MLKIKIKKLNYRINSRISGFKMKRKEVIIALESFLLALLFLTLPIIDVVSFEPPEITWTGTMRTDLTHPVDMFATWNATQGFSDRKNAFLIDANDSDNFRSQPARIYLGNNVSSDQDIIDRLERIYNHDDCLDFDLATLVRLIYLDINKSQIGAPILSTSLKNQITDAFGKVKYWFTDSYASNCIYFTENHQILFHSAELLIGQLFPDDNFVVSGKNGTWHANRALTKIRKWLDWRAQFGFSEWHSNVYYNEDIAALLNIIDFAQDAEIINKSAMVMDLIALDFATNYFNSTTATFAVPQGREYDSHKEGKSAAEPASRDSIAEAAWLMLGIGSHVEGSTGSMAAVALATSDHYAPPPILEEIAKNASKSIELRERNSIDMDQGPDYGISYDEEDMMFWWGMSGPLAYQTIIESLRMIRKYSIKADLVYGPKILTDLFSIIAFFRGISLSQYSKAIKMITEGVCLETANIYTYRTPHYQLSCAQDHRKGMNSMQSHIWQATLDKDATVFTCSPGAITQNFNQRWVGGWMPRATAYKNVNIVQYDRTTMPLEAELLMFFLRLAFGLDSYYVHAHFPQWAFDNVTQYGGWTFGKKGDGYVALYSYKPTWWHANHDLRVQGSKNLWICELGSIDEYGSFTNFVKAIKQAPLAVSPLSVGYSVRYSSPSQGLMTVSWNGPLQVQGSNVDLGPYNRFDNPYCQQIFGDKITNITLPGTTQQLELDFENAKRRYIS